MRGWCQRLQHLKCLKSVSTRVATALFAGDRGVGSDVIPNALGSGDRF